MRDAEVFRYGGNISLIVRKKRIDLPKLGYDKGDIEMLRPFLPKRFQHGLDGSRIEIARYRLG